MNAPTPPNDPAGIDELISAYVDGVAAPDEIAIVEGSAEFMSRVESMRSVSAMLGTPVSPPPDAVREDHLAAALGEFDLLFGDATADRDTSTDATVTPLPQRALEPELAAASSPAPAQQPGVTSLAEARQRKRPRRLNMVAAAAAAVAILFAGVVAVGLNTGGESMDVVADAASDAAEPAIASSIESSEAMVLPEAADARSADGDAMDEEEAMADDAMDDAAMEAEEAAMDEADDDAADAMADDAMADEEAMGEAAPEAEADAESAFAAPVEDTDTAGASQAQPVGFLGAFATIDELTDAANADVADTTAVAAAKDRSAFLPETDCAAIAIELSGLNGATLLSTALLDGNPVELHAAADDQILILSSNDCSIIETIPAS